MKDNHDRPPLLASRVLLEIVLPWFILGFAFAVPLVEQWIGLARRFGSWVANVAVVSCYGLGMAAGVIGIVLLLRAILQVLCYQAYRRSWLAWLRPVLMWLSICCLTAII